MNEMECPCEKGITWLHAQAEGTHNSVELQTSPRRRMPPRPGETSSREVKDAHACANVCGTRHPQSGQCRHTTRSNSALAKRVCAGLSQCLTVLLCHSHSTQTTTHVHTHNHPTLNYFSHHTTHVWEQHTTEQHSHGRRGFINGSITRPRGMQRCLYQAAFLPPLSTRAQ
jgi:hypothetical protein